MIQPLIFNEAGNILLTKYDNCGRLRSDAGSYYRHGDLFSVQPSSSDTTATVESGNSLYPVMTKVTAKSSNLACVFNTLDPEMEAFIYNRNIVKQNNSTMKSINQGFVIPDASPFEVKLPKVVQTPDKVLAVDVANNNFSYTSATPSTAMQFSVSADVVSFSSADAGKSVFLTFDWAAEAFVVETNANETSAIMQLEQSTGAVTEMNKQLYDVYMVYDRVEVTEYGTPLIGKTPGTRQVTFNILKPRVGMPAVITKYVPCGEACE